MLCWIPLNSFLNKSNPIALCYMHLYPGLISRFSRHLGHVPVSLSVSLNSAHLITQDHPVNEVELQRFEVLQYYVMVNDNLDMDPC